MAREITHYVTARSVFRAPRPVRVRTPRRHTRVVTSCLRRPRPPRRARSRVRPCAPPRDSDRRDGACAYTYARDVSLESRCFSSVDARETRDSSDRGAWARSRSIVSYLDGDDDGDGMNNECVVGARCGMGVVRGVGDVVGGRRVGGRRARGMGARGYASCIHARMSFRARGRRGITPRARDGRGTGEEGCGSW